MKRTQVLLALLAALLVAVLFFLLLFQPKRDEVADIEDRIAAEQSQQQQLQQEIQRLRRVRDEAPEVEAELAATEAIVPRDPGLPSALRQLQVAADDSGAILRAVTTARPVEVETDGPAPGGLARIDVTAQLVGGYFQVVDFLRRVEDPQITPRGLAWNTVAISRADYPELNVTLSGSVYAVLPVLAPPPAAEPEPDEETDDGEVTS